MIGVHCTLPQYEDHEVDPNRNGHGSKDHGYRVMVLDPGRNLRDGVMDRLGRMDREAHGCRKKDRHEVGMVGELDYERTSTTVLKVGPKVTHGMRSLDRLVARDYRSENCHSQELTLGCRERYMSRHCDIPLYDRVLRTVEIGGEEGCADDTALVHAHAGVVTPELESRRVEVGISRDSLGNGLLVAHGYCDMLANVFQSQSLLQVYRDVSVVWSDERNLVRPYVTFAQPDAQAIENAP